jgi:membrane protease YdiL (CAAX protease family)
MTARPASFWTLGDVALFAGSILPVYLLASLATRLGAAVLPGAFESPALRMLVFQSTIYGLLLGSLTMVIRTRYGRPLWASLGWTMAFRGAWWILLGAPVLALSMSVLGSVVLRAPAIPSPMEVLMDGRVPVPVVVLFSAIVGPVFEELIFRGFVQSPLERLLGTLPAVALAAAAFALIHGPGYEWSWQHLLVVFIAGSVFGLVKIRTGSTAAPALMHLGYNGTLAVMYLVQQM